MDSVIAKFRCNQVTKFPVERTGQYAQTAHDKIQLGAVYESQDAERDENNPNAKENAIFGKATPHGSLEMTIKNKPAADFFEPGAEYYITFTKVVA